MARADASPEVSRHSGCNVTPNFNAFVVLNGYIAYVWSLGISRLLLIRMFQQTTTGSINACLAAVSADPVWPGYLNY